MKIESKWILLSILGGILMIIGNFSGFRIFSFVTDLYFEYGTPYVNDTVGNIANQIITIFIIIILYIMAGGGISVIIGTILVIAHLYKLGKLIISLGTGMGLIGLSIFLLIEATLINPIETGSDLGFFILRLLIDFYFIGVLLTIIAKRKMKVSSEEPDEIKLLDQILPQEKTEEMPNKIKCPACKKVNNDNDIYCQYCGTALKYNLESHL